MSGKEFQGHLLFPKMENYVFWTEDKTTIYFKWNKEKHHLPLKVGGPATCTATKTSSYACQCCYTTNKDEPDPEPVHRGPSATSDGFGRGVKRGRLDVTDDWRRVAVPD